MQKGRKERKKGRRERGKEEDTDFLTHILRLQHITAEEPWLQDPDVTAVVASHPE